ncbi:hypothetical protein ACTMTJ_20645 [Phytohabitans sp. LJ34]|uniref:hypothetical protein n=1 Tax=Phytohabitans sp. LJ34 TaxID=3452217 RepID=UPI003F8AAB37
MRTILRRALAAGVATIATATALLLPGAPSANAGPTDPPEGGNTACPFDWGTFSRVLGVAHCYSGAHELWLVDRSLGAKLRVVSQRQCCQTGSESRFHKRYAGEWADYIRAGGGPAVPPSSKLFGLVNAGFLVDDGGSTSRLSLPEKNFDVVQTPGYAYDHHGDAAWGFRKRMIRLGDPNAAFQQVAFGDFGNQCECPDRGAYTLSDIFNEFNGFYEATMGFIPWDAPSDANENKGRTLVGYNFTTGRIYIQMSEPVTLAAAVNRLYSVGAEWVIQFDGGRSSQRWSLTHGHWSQNFGRSVPEVLAIYGG